MHRAISQFQQNIAYVRSLGGLYQAIDSLTTPAIDASDLLRAQIVMAVSSLDQFIHELVVAGMVEIYLGSRSATERYSAFQVPIDAAISGVPSKKATWFETVIRQKHGFQSFQSPKRISSVVQLISPCDLWGEVAAAMKSSPKDVKDRLQLIVDRRNKIAHEADLDPTYPGTRWPISQADTTAAVDFIEQICQEIYAIVT